MKNRKWDAKTKVMVVLQGLKGKPVVEICQEHQICSYYSPALLKVSTVMSMELAGRSRE